MFGAHGQLAMGILLVVLTLAQWAYWTFLARPTVGAVFQVSMEALLFAAYAIIATALGYRATERVEAAVVENVEQADHVTIEPS